MKKLTKLSLAFIGAIIMLSQGAVFAKDTTTTTTAPAEETATVTAGLNEDESSNSDVSSANNESTSLNESSTTEDKDNKSETTTATTTATTSLTTSVTTKAATVVKAKKKDAVLFSDGNISIDGYFDDWEDKPKTAVGWSQSMTHHISLYRDENYIYLYVNLAKDFQFTGAAYCVNYDGKNTYFDVRCDGTIPNDGIGSLTIRTQNNWKYVPNSQGYIRREPGQSDLAEVVIPIYEFDRNVKPDEVQSISFSTPNYGPQYVSCSGTSTAPFVSSGIGLAIACTGFVALKKKRNR